MSQTVRRMIAILMLAVLIAGLSVGGQGLVWAAGAPDQVSGQVVGVKVTPNAVLLVGFDNTGTAKREQLVQDGGTVQTTVNADGSFRFSLSRAAGIAIARGMGGKFIGWGLSVKQDGITCRSLQPGTRTDGGNRNTSQQLNSPCYAGWPMQINGPALMVSDVRFEVVAVPTAPAASRQPARVSRTQASAMTRPAGPRATSISQPQPATSTVAAIPTSTALATTTTPVQLPSAVIAPLQPTTDRPTTLPTSTATTTLIETAIPADTVTPRPTDTPGPTNTPLPTNTPAPTPTITPGGIPILAGDQQPTRVAVHLVATPPPAPKPLPPPPPPAQDSNGTLMLGGVVVLVIIGGGVALMRRGKQSPDDVSKNKSKGKRSSTQVERSQQPTTAIRRQPAGSQADDDEDDE